MHKIIAYLKHLRTATNQHGVHSPFVYDYITECLYKKSSFKGSKCTKALLKSISYFSVENLKIISKDSQIENLINKEFNLKSERESPYDLIYLDAPRSDISSILQDKTHNDSIILIKNIHKNGSATFIWEELKRNKTITVSIDMFHFGILSFRKEQVKEHFKIRI